MVIGIVGMGVVGIVVVVAAVIVAIVVLLQGCTCRQRFLNNTTFLLQLLVLRGVNC